MSVTSERPQPRSAWDIAADFLDPPKEDEVDVFAALGYEPNCVPRLKAAEQGIVIPPCGQCPQELFHEATEFDVGYGGARGGGKSRSLAMEGIRACMTYPGLQAFGFRHSYPALKDSFIKELRAVNFARVFGATWNKTDHDLSFPNGSILSLRYCETIDDAVNYQGASMQLVLIDERTTLKAEMIPYLTGGIRSANPKIPVLGIRSSFNPGGVAHAEVRAHYVDSTDHGKNIVTDEKTGRTRRFIQAKATDNPRLNKEYLDDLSALPDALRRAWRDGDWDVFQGMVFTEFLRDRHVVKPFDVPGGWSRILGVDWGYRSPWVAEWLAVDDDDRVWVYRELWDTQTPERDVARRILAAEGDESVTKRVGDPSMAAKQGEATPSLQIFAEEGVVMEKAQNDRLSGWQRVHTYLADGSACAYHRVMGWETCPMLHIFESCPKLIETMPALTYDNHSGKTEDVLKSAIDHWSDAFRYGLMAVGTAPQYFWPSDVGNAANGRQMAIDGQTPLAEPYGGLFALPPGQAQGPRSNGYGW